MNPSQEASFDRILDAEDSTLDLALAAKAGDIGGMRAAVAAGANLNVIFDFKKKGAYQAQRTILGQAALGGQGLAVQWLLDSGAKYPDLAVWACYYSTLDQLETRPGWGPMRHPRLNALIRFERQPMGSAVEIAKLLLAADRKRGPLPYMLSSRAEESFIRRTGFPYRMPR